MQYLGLILVTLLDLSKSLETSHKLMNMPSLVKKSILNHSSFFLQVFKIRSTLVVHVVFDNKFDD